LPHVDLEHLVETAEGLFDCQLGKVVHEPLEMVLPELARSLAIPMVAGGYTHVSVEQVSVHNDPLDVANVLVEFKSL
jgi:hypothetical protein